MEELFMNIDKYFKGYTKKYIINDEINIENNNFCVSFFIDNEIIENPSIGIIKLNKCGFSGSNILKKLELLAISCEIYNIYLHDKAHLKITYLESDFSNVEDVKIDFSSLYIYVNGKSWYNSFNYYQKNYNKESREWRTIRKKILHDILELINYDKYNNSLSNEYDNGIEVFCSISEIEINHDNFNDLIFYFIELLFKNCEDLGLEYNSLEIVFEKVYYKIKINEFNILHHLLLSICSIAINYTRYPLFKNI